MQLEFLCYNKKRGVKLYSYISQINGRKIANYDGYEVKCECTSRTWLNKTVKNKDLYFIKLIQL